MHQLSRYVSIRLLVASRHLAAAAAALQPRAPRHKTQQPARQVVAGDAAAGRYTADGAALCLACQRTHIALVVLRCHAGIAQRHIADGGTRDPAKQACVLADGIDLQILDGKTPPVQRAGEIDAAVANGLEALGHAAVQIPVRRGAGVDVVHQRPGRCQVLRR